jgi:uroporphyrinogen decarboxylase
MNGYERIKSALQGQWPDLRPVMLHNFMLAAKEAGLKMKDYYNNARNVARAHIEAVEKYGLDGLLLDIDTAVLASAVGVPVDYPVDEPALETLEEVEDLNPVDVSKDERVQICLEAARIIKKHFGDEVFIRGNCDQAPFSLASMMRTPAAWMIDLLTDETRCFRLLDFCRDACLQFIDLMAHEGVHMISNGDSPAGPEMISPVMYRKFAKPYEEQLRKKSHERELPYLVHICGNTEIILDEIKGINPDAVELDYRTDVTKIHDTYKDSITFFGNIDPVGVLTEGVPALVEQKALEILKLYEDSPRFVMNAGCAIPPTAPEENIRKLVEITNNY